MDKNKQDLLLQITQQEDSLKRYKARLQDVVAAYKRLTAEKESIEKSLKAAVQTTKNISLEINSKQTDDNSDDIFSLKSRINTLALSLSDLTIEKSKIESEFQADRKRLLLENKQKQDIINDLKKQLEKQGSIRDIVVPYLHESRNADVSRTELLLNDETNQINVDELRNQLTKKLEEIVILKKSNSELLSQIQCLKAVCNTNDDSSDKSSVHVLNKLKEELRTIQEQHNRAIQQEQRRVAEVEERSRLLVIAHENRVTKLEDQLTELSNLICDYDRSRQTDREAISKLKNRLLHLEMDNRNSACEDDRNEPSREELIQQLINLKRILLLQSNTPEEFQHLKDCLMNDLDYSDISLENFHNSGSDRNNYNNERIESLQHIIEELKVDIMKLITVNKHFESKYEQIKSILEKERKLWEEKLNTSETEYRRKLLLVEEKLMEERDKNADVINEKDKQIMMLQQTSNYNHAVKEDADDEQVNKNGIVKEETKEKIDTVSLFHYVQDGAYKEAEINRLREANNELENKIHNMQKDIYFREEVYKKSITQLKDYICRLERSSIMKDETSAEYLKNVILNFLSTVDNDKRMHMLNAIFTVLHLTDKEISQVMKYQMK